MTALRLPVGAIALLLPAGVCALALACSHPADDPTGAGEDAGPIDLNQVTGHDGGKKTTTKPLPDGGTIVVPGDDDDTTPTDDPDAGGETPGGAPLRFATKVVSFTPGPCAGFGQSSMPDIVLGPPRGTGDAQGSLDVVSLGRGGEIVLSFEPYAIVDGPGNDFIVFENAFFAGGDPQNPYAEPAEVSVSEDGSAWTPFPCTATAPPYGACAGWHPVYASGPDFDPAKAGGDPYDLSAIGVAHARFVRIQDKTAQRCTSQGPDTNGFDLDAIAILNSAGITP